MREGELGRLRRGGRMGRCRNSAGRGSRFNRERGNGRQGKWGGVGRQVEFRRGFGWSWGGREVEIGREDEKKMA